MGVLLHPGTGLAYPPTQAQHTRHCPGTYLTRYSSALLLSLRMSTRDFSCTWMVTCLVISVVLLSYVEAFGQVVTTMMYLVVNTKGYQSS